MTNDAYERARAQQPRSDVEALLREIEYLTQGFIPDREWGDWMLRAQQVLKAIPPSLRAQGQQAGGADMVLVPKEATPAMLKAGADEFDWRHSSRHPTHQHVVELVWNQMLAAAPQPSTKGETE